MFMRVGALCAVRERTRRVLVIFPCFSDLQAVFTDFRTLCDALFCPFLDFFMTKTASSCVHFYVFRLFVFSFLFALSLEKYGG